MFYGTYDYLSFGAALLYVSTKSENDFIIKLVGSSTLCSTELVELNASLFVVPFNGLKASFVKGYLSPCLIISFADICLRDTETCATAVKNPCQQICSDIKSGGFFCQCRTGYIINSDGMTCTEIWQPEKQTPIDSKGAAMNKEEPLYSVPATRNTDVYPSRETRYNSEGEVMISDDEVVHIKSIDLTRSSQPLQADNMRRGNDENDNIELKRGYNVAEGGTDPDNLKISINMLDVVKEGDMKADTVLDPPRPFTGNVEEDVVINCKDLACKGNASCAIINEKATCLCTLGRYGKMCQKEVEVRYPKFKGTGYLALPVLRDAHKAFSVSLEFKPQSPYGLLLFSGEFSNARTDFFSVALDDGFVILRFDCGTGVAQLRSLNRVQLAEWNMVVLTRVDNKATLRLNGDRQVEGVSQGNYTRITFRLNLYLGGYADMSAIKSRVGTKHQFVGCVQELRINGHPFDFRTSGPVGEAEFGINVGECSQGVCDQVQCQNGGQCTARSADRHVCLCPLGFHGSSCEKDSPVHIPHFSGHSYVELAGLQRSVLSYTEIELVFKPTSYDGTILYNGYSQDRRGDFISLAMDGGHLVFRFDLGTGPAELRSLDPVTLNKWHLVRASRTGLLGTMQVDDQPIVSGQSQGAYIQLTLLDPLYLGGHPNYDHTSKHAKASHSFTGCLQKVVINKKAVDMLGSSVAGVNIGPCSHPCAGKPCLNDGQCKPRLDTYTCHCPLGFSNSNCEDVIEPLPTKPMFSGESYLIYRDKEITKRISGKRMDLQMYIRPYLHDGLIFWSGEDQSFSTSSDLSSMQDFIALGFVKGGLQLRYNLGSGEALITYNDSRLFDGEWHFIRVQRYKQDAYMEIDRREVVEGSSQGEYTSLNTNKIVYLGGMPDVVDATGGRFASSFVGCVQSLKLSTDYDVKLLDQAYTGVNIEQCHKWKVS
ncbi:pikachurin-like [Elysia marginata]|uniref:Pikachurin-like n=1 Tax=Elysia marginata TaxID=1093978 RepID=A0AAV4F755_9GAST|nr:pikachurin-like [Elysia marginata]